MNRLHTLGFAFGLLVLTVNPVRAGDHDGCCCPPASVSFHVEVQESKCVKMVEETVWKIVEKTTVKDVPVTKMVEVCVVDPCTGCKKTECHPETVIEKVKCTSLDWCKERKLKPVEKISSCVNVYMTEVPACPTAAPSCPTCGH
jgi:hypothetical protein